MILIARSLGSLLPTVLSRCAKVPFAALSPADFGAWCKASGQQELVALGPAAGYSPGQALGLSDGKVLGWLEQLDALGQSQGEARRDRLAASLAAAIGKTGDQSFRNPFLRALRARQPRPGSEQSGQDQRLYRAALNASPGSTRSKSTPRTSGAPCYGTSRVPAFRGWATGSQGGDIPQS